MSARTAAVVRAVTGTDQVPGWETSVIGVGRRIVEALGVPVHLDRMDPDTAFGVVVLPALLLLLVLATQARTIVRVLSSRDFWRDGGRLLVMLQLFLLLLAYTFSRGDRSRTFGEAVADVLSGRLPDILPLAIASQWALLSVLWLVFGVLTGVDRRSLLAPFATVRDMALIATLIVGFTAAWMAPRAGSGIAGRYPAIVAVTSVVLIYGYLTAVSRNRVLRSPAALRRHQEAMEHAQRQNPDDALVAALRMTVPQARVAAGPVRALWAPAPTQVLLMSLFWALLLCVPAAVITWVYRAGRFTPPRPGAVVHAELLVFTVLLLIMLFSFRRDLDGWARVSPAIPRLFDLSLLLSAGLLALAGASDSPVTLGPVPTWLVAVGPALLAAILVLLLGVLPHRHDTRRFGLVLPAAVVVAPLILPLKTALVALLNPVIHALVL